MKGLECLVQECGAYLERKAGIRRKFRIPGCRGRMDELGAGRRVGGCYQGEETVSGPGWWLWAGKKSIYKRNLICTYLVKTPPKEGEL